MKRYDKIQKTREAAKVAQTQTPNPPPHLSKKMKEFWCSVFKLATPQPFEVLILKEACEAFDRAEQARRILKKEGLVYSDRFQQPRSRPEVGIERDSKALFAKLLKQGHLHNPFWDPDLD
jgi:phage terminase small subunit